MIPNIKYYARMEYCQDSRKTPKYVIAYQAGFYQPMEKLRGRNGLISMYLMEKLKEGVDVPSMRLQAKDSLNFTGLKDFFINGNLSGFAYGYPLQEMTYSSKHKENPFYDYKDDGYLFIIHQDEKNQNLTPTVIELIVLDKAKVLITAYCKQLVIGGFDEAIKSLRGQTKPVAL